MSICDLIHNYANTKIHYSLQHIDQVKSKGVGFTTLATCTHTDTQTQTHRPRHTHTHTHSHTHTYKVQCKTTQAAANGR